MKRAVWFFGAAVVAVLGGLVAVSVAALHSEAEAEAARQRRAERDRLRVALWRLDAHILPLLGRLAALDYSHYVPAFEPLERYTARGDKRRRDPVLEPSPILRRAWPAWVRLHFQAPASGEILSPQVPGPRYAWVRRALALGSMDRKRASLADLRLHLTPPVRRDLVRRLRASAEAGSVGAGAAEGGAEIAGIGRTWRGGNQAPRRLPEQRLVAENNDVQQKLNTPAARQVPIDNVLKNVGRQNPHNWTGSVRVALSPVRTAWLRGAKGGGGAPQLLAYRVAEVRGEPFLQGVWLDWARLRRELRALIRDLYPGARLVALRPDGPKGPTAAHKRRAMVTLPVALVGARASAAAGRWYRATPVRTALLFAWVLTLLALLAIGLAVRRTVELGRRRMNFVNAASHELRAPLTALRLHLDMLAEGMITAPERRQATLEKLRGQAERLGDLVQGVLDFARLERRAVVTRVGPVELRPLLEEMTESGREQLLAARSALELVAEWSALPERVVVRTDPDAVRQVVSNLIDNAAKYAAGADDRRIHLRARVAGRRVEIEVEDHGPGIPTDARRRLFEAFYRAGDEMTREHPGVGLGLALSRRFAEAAGARLTLAGAPRPDGSYPARFVLSLPLA